MRTANPDPAPHSPFVRLERAYNHDGDPIRVLARGRHLESLLAMLDDGRPQPAAVKGRVPVLMPVALDQTYDYLLPAGIEAEPGTFVLVPFGRSQRIGIVWDRAFGEGGKPVADKKLSPSRRTLADVPPLPAISLRFAEWMARYTLSPLGMVVRMMMGSSAVFEPVRPRFGVRRNEAAASRRG